MDVVESIESGLHVASGRTMIVGREEGVNESKYGCVQMASQPMIPTRLW